MKLKVFFLLSMSISLFNNCKAQSPMNNQITITLLDKESKEHPFFTTTFNTIFDWKNQILYEKNEKKPFSGNIQVNYSNGNPNVELNYLNGKKDGKYLSYHPNGNIKEEGHYINDESTGITKNYDENGNIHQLSEYLTKTDELETWKSIEYYSNGHKKEEGNMIKSTKSLVEPIHKTGYWIYYYEHGQKKEEGNWEIGGMHGSDNIRIGEWKLYSESGVLIKTIKFDNDGNQFD